jgi:hypothetical protein
MSVCFEPRNVWISRPVKYKQCKGIVFSLVTVGVYHVGKHKKTTKKWQLAQHYSKCIDCRRLLAHFLAGGAVAFCVLLLVYLRTQRRQPAGQYRHRPSGFNDDNVPFFYWRLITSGTSPIKSILTFVFWHRHVVSICFVSTTQQSIIYYLPWKIYFWVWYEYIPVFSKFIFILETEAERSCKVSLLLRTYLL